MLRNRTSFVWSLLLMLGVAACSDENPVAGLRPVESADEAQLRGALEARGFDASTMKIDGEHVTVEGDIVFGRADLLAPELRLKIPGRNTADQQWYFTAPVSLTNIRSVTINLSALSGAYLTAFQNAITNLNASLPGAAINIVSGSPADITVVVETGSSASGCTAGKGSWPTGGNVGPTVTIFTACTGSGTNWRTWLATHEIGHNLGLYHTKEVNGTYSGLQVPGTTQNDPSSFMKPIVSAWTGFTSNDILALQYMYRLPSTLSSLIWGASALVQEPGQYTANASVGLPWLSQWGISSTIHYKWMVQYCYDAFGCSWGSATDGSHGVEWEGDGGPYDQFTMNFYESDVIRHVYLVVTEVGGYGRTGTASKFFSGPTF